ncbi:MAG: Bax inhibitor-1/YccA family protein, partial [Fusobacteriaceae bacterium]|nr:Bax inhibitor-1/YccA family protein [Fusobacteriaceae bacterium]
EGYQREDGYNPAEIQETTVDLSGFHFLRKSFLHMTMGILVPAAVAVYFLFFDRRIFFAIRDVRVIGVIQLVVVLFLSFSIRKISFVTAVILFYLYSALTGVTFAYVGALYSPASVLYTFAITLTIFAALSVYGYLTKEDLRGYGKFFMIGLLSLILLSVVNLFLNASTLYWIGTVAGVAIFTLLIAYDVNRIKRWSEELIREDPAMAAKMGIIGALELYLDFINLFLYALRIFGKRRN